MLKSSLKVLSLALPLALTALGSGLAQAKTVTYEVKGKKYEGYIVAKGESAPLVVIFHDWDGLTDYEKKRADMLGVLGYSVFAADLFGKDIRPTEDKDRKQHTGELYKDRQKLRDLMNAALDVAGKNQLNTKNAFAIGYCFGGAAVLELARSGADLKGFASFHGGLATPEGQDYKKTKGRINVYHGTADSAISMTEFATLATELEAAKIPHEMVSYGGAPHAFTVIGSPMYREDADRKSWTSLQTFMAENTDKAK
jgi:dienelactone hydrolase